MSRVTLLNFDLSKIFLLCISIRGQDLHSPKNWTCRLHLLVLIWEQLRTPTTTTTPDTTPQYTPLGRHIANNTQTNHSSGKQRYYNVKINQNKLKTRNPKVVWEQPHCHPHDRAKWTHLLRVQCQLQISPITQPLVRYIHITVPHQCMQFRSTTPQSPHWLQWDAPRLPLKMPLPLRRSPPPSNAPILDRPHSPLQTASRSNQPLFHNSPTGQTDRPTDRRTDREMG